MSRCEILEGDCRELLAAMEPDSVDAIVTDPPYGLEFMGKEWDRLNPYERGNPQMNQPPKPKKSESNWTVTYGTPKRIPRCRKCEKQKYNHPKSRCQCADPEWDLEGYHHNYGMQAWHEAWAREAYRVLKPGGHLLAFGGSRTYHRMACAVEDAGFEIRDQIQYLYGSGFPKSANLDRLRGEKFCGCEPTTERDLRSMRSGDVSEAEHAGDQRGQVLLPWLSESSAPAPRTTGTKPELGRTEEPRLEGRRDLLQEEGKLQKRPLCASPGMGATDGTGGRIHHGPPAGHGGNGGATPGTGGGRPSSGPRPDEQRAGEPGIVADEPRPQARGAWPICGRCGLSVIPRGLGTALKPAHEPIVVARKPLVGTVAQNVERHGTGALNIDGCRIEATAEDVAIQRARTGGEMGVDDGRSIYGKGSRLPAGNPAGRWPANVVLGHHPDCQPPNCHPECAGAMLDEQSGCIPTQKNRSAPDAPASNAGMFGVAKVQKNGPEYLGDFGGASRFFKTVEWSPDEVRFRYCPKADRSERETGCEGMPEYRNLDLTSGDRNRENERAGTNRNGPIRASNHHPTVKPVDLMRWLVRLVTPPGGLVVDPFAGSGTTGVACSMEGFDFVGMELDPEYVRIARARIGAAPLSLFGAPSRETP